MPLTLGGVTVPSYTTTTNTFPITPDFPFVTIHQPNVVIHRFASGKNEQRFYTGTGARRFTVRLAKLTPIKRRALTTFWEQRQGAYGQFHFNLPSDDGTNTSQVTCCFADPTLTLPGLFGCITTVGVTLVEVPTTSPVYGLNATVTRFPSDVLATALLDQVQTIIPLVYIRVSDESVQDIFVSDRECKVGDVFYQARLLKARNVSQAIGGASDDAYFDFGNADKVMTAIANKTVLKRAKIQFSLFHLQTGIKLDFFAGYIKDWAFKPDGTVFTMTAADGAYELTLGYPFRTMDHECYKPFDDGALCPFASVGHTSTSRTLKNADGTDTTYHFTPDASKCDLGWATPNGCLAHNMDNYFGGIEAQVQSVTTKDNSTGFHGLGRAALTTSSLISDSLYDATLPEIYCDLSDYADPTIGVVTSPAIFEGRDEGDFYDAGGIVGAGPLTEFAHNDFPIPQDQRNLTGIHAVHTLDNQPNHGWPKTSYGLRLSLGADPNPDPFSLGQGGSGPQTYGPNRAAGVAFAEIRRTDQKGLQLSRLSDHSMSVTIRRGLGGWTWTGPVARSWTAPLTNPIWIAVNTFLRAKGLSSGQGASADADVQEKLLNIPQLVADAAICDTMIPPLMASPFSSVKQFTFQGVIGPPKPLRAWLQEILNTCLGDFWFSFGRFTSILRFEFTVAPPSFTIGNILWESLELGEFNPEFNWLKGTFGDVAYGSVENSVRVRDITHATTITGSLGRPEWLRKTMNFVGASTTDQVARIVSTRIREGLGGIKPAHYQAARTISFSSTILSLVTAPGMVCSLEHPDMPDFVASNDGAVPDTPNYGEFRIEKITLNEDYSMRIWGQTIHRDMYDLTVGPRPTDMTPSPIPGDDDYAPKDIGFDVAAPGDGTLDISNFVCGSYGDAVHAGYISIYYIDEVTQGITAQSADTDLSTDTINWAGVPPAENAFLLIDSELMAVISVVNAGGNAGTAQVLRAQLGTTAATHLRISTTVSSINSSWPNEFTIGPGLKLYPGQNIVAPSGNQAVIGYYNAATGLVRTLRPIDGLTVGNAVYADPLIYTVQLHSETVPFSPYFFRSANRANFQEVISLGLSSVVLVTGVYENTRGLRSEPFVLDYVAAPVRTLGNHGFQFPFTSLPPGTGNDIFEIIRAPEPHSFQRAYATINGGDLQPLPKPRAISRIQPSLYTEAGRITLAGTPSGIDQIGVSFAGTNSFRVPTFLSTEHAITSSSSVHQAAVALTQWLNDDHTFSSYYSALIPPGSTGGVIQILDTSGAGGMMTVTTGAGTGVTATATGLTSALGILSGRKYAACFLHQGRGAFLRGDLSPVSQSTGPTGSALNVALSGVPQSSDSRVTDIEIYATPDGRDSPFYLVRSVAANVNITYDAHTETDLLAQSQYPGPTHPTVSGLADIDLTVTLDGSPWFDLRIPAGSATSNIVDGLAVGSVGTGAQLNVNITANDGGDVSPDLLVVIE